MELLRGRRMHGRSCRDLGAALVAVAGPVVSGAVPVTDTALPPHHPGLRAGGGGVADARRCSRCTWRWTAVRRASPSSIGCARGYPAAGASASPPFWQGTDTGFARPRSQVWKRGRDRPRRSLRRRGSVRRLGDQDARIGRNLGRGSARTWMWRLSARFPTRSSAWPNTCTDVEDAVLVAAFARALRRPPRGRGRGASWWTPRRVDELRVASWRRSPNGVAGSADRPGDAQRRGCRGCSGGPLAHTGEALEEAGDLTLARRGVDRLLDSGSVQLAQREVYARTNDLCLVVRDLVSRTVAGDA